MGKASGQRQAVSSYVWGDRKGVCKLLTTWGVSTPNSRVVQESTVFNRGCTVRKEHNRVVIRYTVMVRLRHSLGVQGSPLRKPHRDAS